jgi:Arc/MetJ-type ribon-helix-helix transcriptional regulator
MQVRLSPAHQRYVRKKIATGESASATEVVAQALMALRRQDQLRREIDIGLADLRAGRVSDWNVEEAKEELLRRMKRKKKVS